jgi:hypothetical protein
MSVDRKLIEAGVTFTTKQVLSNFWGLQYNFPTLKDARKAEKATGFSVHGKRGNYHFTLY